MVWGVIAGLVMTIAFGWEESSSGSARVRKTSSLVHVPTVLLRLFNEALLIH